MVDLIWTTVGAMLQHKVSVPGVGNKGHQVLLTVHHSGATREVANVWLLDRTGAVLQKLAIEEVVRTPDHMLPQDLMGIIDAALATRIGRTNYDINSALKSIRDLVFKGK